MIGLFLERLGVPSSLTGLVARFKLHLLHMYVHRTRSSATYKKQLIHHVPQVPSR